MQLDVYSFGQSWSRSNTASTNFSVHGPNAAPWCASSSVTMNLTQSGTTFSGTTPGGTFQCSAPGIAPIIADLDRDVIANGQINGNSVTFDISTSDIHNTGRDL